MEQVVEAKYTRRYDRHTKYLRKKYDYVAVPTMDVIGPSVTVICSVPIKNRPRYDLGLRKFFFTSIELSTLASITRE